MRAVSMQTTPPCPEFRPQRPCLMGKDTEARVNLLNVQLHECFDCPLLDQGAVQDLLLSQGAIAIKYNFAHLEAARPSKFQPRVNSLYCVLLRLRCSEPSQTQRCSLCLQAVSAPMMGRIQTDPFSCCVFEFKTGRQVIREYDASRPGGCCRHSLPQCWPPGRTSHSRPASHPGAPPSAPLPCPGCIAHLGVFKIP